MLVSAPPSRFSRCDAATADGPEAPRVVALRRTWETLDTAVRGVVSVAPVAWMATREREKARMRAKMVSDIYMSKSIFVTTQPRMMMQTSPGAHIQVAMVPCSVDSLEPLPCDGDGVSMVYS